MTGRNQGGLHQNILILTVISIMVVKNRDFYFRESLSWSKVTSSGFSLRYFPKDLFFDVSGCSNIL